MQPGQVRSPASAQQEVAIGPPVLPPEVLVGDHQALSPQPPGRLFTARVVVVTGNVPLGDLAPYRGQSARGKARLPGARMIAYDLPRDWGGACWRDVGRTVQQSVWLWRLELDPA